MAKTTKFILTIMLSFTVLGAVATVNAEEPAISTIGQIQEFETQEISAEELNVKDQKFLPDNPFYFLKEWTRNVRIAFAFSEIKKAELENRFASEKLIELKKLAENGVNSEKIKKAIKNYQNAINKIKERADKIKENAADSEAVNKFLEKFTNHQILQEKILQKLETRVPEQAFEKIKEAREQHMEKFGQVMQKLEDRQDKIKEKIENALQNGDESNIEILDKIKEKMPDDMKEKLESMRGNMMEKVNDKLIEKATEINNDYSCPSVINPSSDFCKNGKIKLEKDDSGCISKIKCIPLKAEICTMEYAPVCGKNGKTYGNTCHAKVAGAKIDYEGECDRILNIKCKTDADCPQPNCGTSASSDANCLGRKTICVEGKCKVVKTSPATEINCKKLWWFDNQNKTCQQKEFCGAYMYQGLRTFSFKNQCVDNLDEPLIHQQSCETQSDCPDCKMGGTRCINKKCQVNCIPYKVTEKEFSWTEALKILKSGQVKIAGQTDNKIVRLTLKNGTEIKTTEPEIDDIFDEIEKCGKICENIIKATE